MLDVAVVAVLVAFVPVAMTFFAMAKHLPTAAADCCLSRVMKLLIQICRLVKLKSI